MARDNATLRQISASRPDRSTWLSANAGSGKTKVLTDRVARLLLDGINPQHILCLTYTKAAASEMQNRLFRRLGAWAMLRDEGLSVQLTELGYQGEIDAELLRQARRLFASAIETPGGLKIQTIHSFCSALLRRFPLEAGITPQFSEMEERAAALLRTEIVEQIASGPKAECLYALVRHYTGEALEELTAAIVRHGPVFAGRPDAAQIAALYGQSQDLDETAIFSMAFVGRETDLIKSLIPVLNMGGVQDQRAAAKLAGISSLDIKTLPLLESVFLTQAGAKEPFSAKIGSFPSKASQKNLSAHMPEIEAWMKRVELAREARIALSAMRKTSALHEFASVFLPAYEEAKQLRGWLDFDDLILRARDLLTDPAVAAWVLYRLDGGIDHILVDEAQDTSPAQWQVIEKLAQEFTSGEGARPDILRTIFVVGDKKQSIYSFQGADPREFDRMKQDFANRLTEADRPLQDLEMTHSFRSSSAILSLVDQTFANREQSGFSAEQGHNAFYTDMPGRVDLWPIVEKPTSEDDPEWFRPVDIKTANDPSTILARQIATTIKQMLGQPLPDESGENAHAIQAGDFLILVQRRSHLFHEIIRECKRLDLPVAGADRLRVGAEIAVRDLAALLSFLATPEDSLSLATALRSPLFSWSEGDLFGLAHGRKQKYLWAELRDRAEEFPDTFAILRDLRDQADFLRPYDLIERILTRHNGRDALLARLGPEAEDGIDAFLAQAMSYERNAIDSLTGFLVWMETDALEIKRQIDSAGNLIRVMTVHGAKGLEAPIVILPDTAKRPLVLRDPLAVSSDTVLWRTNKDETPRALEALDQEAKAEAQAERDRLLYVAMTRAEKWLIVACAGDPGKGGESWYNMIHDGLVRSNAADHSFDGGVGLRLEKGGWNGLPIEAEAPVQADTVSIPELYLSPAPAVGPTTATLRPSDLGGAKALPGEEGLDEDAALRRGRQIHRLLEFLPQYNRADWPESAARLLGQGPDAATGQELALLLAETDKVLTRATLAPLFTPDALAEVSVSAPVEALGGQRVHGTIDRLVINHERVLAVDFKTNAAVPDTPADCPDGLLRQMGAYSHALSTLYPDREIQAALLWTRTATLMMLPHDIVTNALKRTYIP